MSRRQAKVAWRAGVSVASGKDSSLSVEWHVGVRVDGPRFVLTRKALLTLSAFSSLGQRAMGRRPLAGAELFYDAGSP